MGNNGNYIRVGTKDNVGCLIKCRSFGVPMNTLKHFTNEDLRILLKEETKCLNEGVKNNLPSIELERISNVISDIAMELFGRMPLGSKGVDLDKLI